jgi:hypothetical protein
MVARRPRRRGDFQRLVAATVALGLMLAGRPFAQASKPLDYEVKAVYLHNFGRFVMWPPTDAAADAPFNICVLGRDPFGQTLDATVAAELIDGKPVMTRRIARVEELTGCRIVFVSLSEDHQVPAIVRTLERAGVLTVSDMPRFVDRGGMIQFVSADNKVRFQINIAAAQRAGLALSSELLRVAVSVKTAEQPER